MLLRITWAYTKTELKCHNFYLVLGGLNIVLLKKKTHTWPIIKKIKMYIRDIKVI